MLLEMVEVIIKIAPSKWVNIHTKNGIVKGVFGWPAIHVRDHAKEAPPKIDNIFIDIGAKDKKEVEKMGVHVGCVITYPDSFHILNKNKFVCRAIDNRAGGFMIAEVARLIKENKDKLFESESIKSLFDTFDCRILEIEKENQE